MPLLSTDDRTLYFRLLELHNANRIDYNTRKWETLKFSQLVFAASLALPYAVLPLIREFDARDPMVAAALGVLIVAPLVLAVAIAIFGRRNFERESKLLFMEEGSMFKLARFLNLDQSLIGNTQWIAGDEHLLMPKWRRDDYGLRPAESQEAFDSWVERRTARHMADFPLFRRRAFIVCVVGVALVVGALVVLISNRYQGAREIEKRFVAIEHGVSGIGQQLRELRRQISPPPSEVPPPAQKPK
jgi:hypothetical protein